jgi:hypothetical protein
MTFEAIVMTDHDRNIDCRNRSHWLLRRLVNGPTHSFWLPVRSQDVRLLLRVLDSGIASFDVINLNVGRFTIDRHVEILASVELHVG